MGSKHRLLPWIYGVLRGLAFETAADPFVGTGCVAYPLKAIGKRVIASDFLNFPAVVATATIANDQHRLDGGVIERLLAPAPRRRAELHREDLRGHFLYQFNGASSTTRGQRFLRRHSTAMSG